MNALGVFFKNVFPQPLLSLVLVLVWILMGSGLSWGNTLLGLILGWGIPHLTAHFWPDAPVIRSYWKIFPYALKVAWDIMMSSIEVALLILRHREPRSAFISYPLRLEHPSAITILAASVSLTPGTVSCDVSEDGRMLLIHALDAGEESEVIESIQERYENHLMEIFS